MGQILSLISFLILRILSNPIANTMQKKLSTNNSSIVINFYTYLVLSLFCIPFTTLDKIVNYNYDFYFLVLIAGFLCSLGCVCLIKAVSIGELSVLGPINSYKSIVGLISSIFILKEFPSFFGIIGIILIIWGSKFIFTSYESGFSFKLFKQQEIQLRLFALLLTGVEAAILKKIIVLSSVEVCFLMWCFSGLIWSLLFVLILKKDIKISVKKSLPTILLIALCLGIMQYSTNYVFERMNVGYALALFQLSSLVTVFLGYKMFNEKNILNKIIGSLIMIIGSILIIFQ